ncbi:hypothetical protein QR680_014564 [Steinernema hermaphroditum]|uniref:MADF domain-containing protein n=1 Tax=Steinernema hermaphroditum TaxID=289476 RepID=A0AA39IAY8_9BILA|nr:hypothetical protein QR680_014564 [Steinernema hermaphroditum]
MTSQTRRLPPGSFEAFNGQLIDHVKEHPVIYDFAAEGYKNTKEKKRAWEKVTQQWNEDLPESVDVDFVQNRWKNLRTTYGKKKKHPPSGSGANGPEWPFLESMRFLDHFDPQRHQLSSQSQDALSDHMDDEGEIPGVASTPLVTPKRRKKRAAEDDVIMEMLRQNDAQIGLLAGMNSRNHHFGQFVAKALDEMTVAQQKKTRIDIMRLVESASTDRVEPEEDEDEAMLKLAGLLLLKRRAILSAMLARRRRHLSVNRRGPTNLRTDDKRFMKYLRMKPATFDRLLFLVEQQLEQKRSQCNNITAEEMLVITLRFLATGASFHSLHFTFRLGVSTVSMVVRTMCTAIINALADNVHLPESENEWLEVSQLFEDRWSFPNVLGAIDGKHVRIKRPENSGSLYFNHKGWFSTVLLAISDARYKFLYYSIGSYGHHNDSQVFRDSTFGRQLEQETLRFPPNRNLPMTDCCLPYYFLADGGFALKDRIMKPYPGMQETDNATFNLRLSHARRVIESAFGILCARFRILLKDIETDVSLADDIVRATIHLHNYLSDELPFDPARITVDATQTLEDAPVRPANGNRPTRSAQRIRKQLTEYFVGVGAVDWQEKHVNRY